MRPCWLLKSLDVCMVHLGKYGDIMIMLPAFKAVADQLGKPVICMVSKDYASIFEGVSYVTPWVQDLHWWKGVGRARKIAEEAGLDPVVIKWWDEPGAKPPLPLEPGKTISLKIHGVLRKVNAADWDSFQASQWRYAGFTMEQMMQWPLVFDRRNTFREQELRRRSFKTERPKLLVNLSQSGTSPFGASLQAYAMLHMAHMEIVNLAGIRAHRIFDLLGLYDNANLLVTSDTATLHLAAASKIPYIAFINNGGAGSIPKGDCRLAIRYGEFQQRMGDYVEALKSFSK